MKKIAKMMEIFFGVAVIQLIFFTFEEQLTLTLINLFMYISKKSILLITNDIANF